MHSVSSKIAYSLDARLYAKCGKLDRPRGAHICKCAHLQRDGGGGTQSKERLWVVLSNGLRPLATKKDFVGETI